MLKMNSYFKSKSCIAVFGLVFLPILLHLNDVNLSQYSKKEILYLSYYHLVANVIIFILSYLLCLVLKNIRFFQILICNLIFFFFQFYFIEILNSSFFVSLNSIYQKLDFIVLCIFYLSGYIALYLTLTKHTIKIYNFLILFLSLNYLFSGINIASYYIEIKLVKNSENFKSEKIVKTDNDIALQQIKSIKKPVDVYFIIPDAMISLQKAEKLNFISSAEKQIQNLNEQSFFYNPKFKSNYSSTHLSVKTALIGNYPIDENSEKYFNRKGFFPDMMKNKNNHFYDILNKLGFDFYYIGNSWGPCPIADLDFETCKYNYSSPNKLKISYLNNYVLFLEKSLLKKILDIVNYKYNLDIANYNFIKAYNFLLGNSLFEENISNKNSRFFLIHILKPRTPYNLDQNCKFIGKINETKSIKLKQEYYGYSYNCVLNTILNWETKLQKIDPNREKIIFIFADHGETFSHIPDKNIEISKRLNNIFYAHKIPNRCNSINPPKSQVNIMRFLIKCLSNPGIPYLDDIQYLTYYEKHKQYGNVYKFKKEK